MAAQPQRRQDEAGAPAGSSGSGAVSPALWARLLDPASWRESLEAYAAVTTLAIALVDATGRLRGPCLHPRPTWSRLHAPPEAATGCPFALASPTPCTCFGDALARRALVLARDRAGLVHVAVPLVLDDQPVGALLAGQGVRERSAFMWVTHEQQMVLAPHHTIRREQVAQVLLRDAEREIPHIHIHRMFLLGQRHAWPL